LFTNCDIDATWNGELSRVDDDMFAADELRIGPDTTAPLVAALSLSLISRFLFGSKQIGVTGIICLTFLTVLSFSLFFTHI
jgi:hypothetical protein